jgi:hypothetical protein
MALLLIVGASVLTTAAVFAVQQPESSNYRFDETSISTGGLINANSTNYQSTSGVGDLSVGHAASTNYQTEAGSRTEADPVLMVAVTDATADFGNFSSSVPATATATFEVTNYTSYGYVAQLAGDAPTNGGHAITALASTSGSVSGIEQFGVNVVANTSPVSFGANPDNGVSGYGEAAVNYNTPNQYRYVSGETIALAPKSSGKTIYTLSYLVNVRGLTPGGQYSSEQSIIVTGTY